MHLAKTQIKGWLKQQHHIIHNCISVVLVAAAEGDNSTYLAQFPEISPHQTSTIDHAMALAIKEVTHKKRLYLAPVEIDHMLMAQPIMHHEKLCGVVILLIGTKDKKVIADNLKLLHQGMVWLKFIVTQQELSSVVGENSFNTVASDHSQSSQLLHMMESLLKENSLHEMAITLVNFFATQLQAYRVSFGLLKNNAIELMAVSFSANFDKHTSAMQAISDAMDEAVDQRTNIHVDKNSVTTSDDSIMQRCHDYLLHEQQALAIDSFLLRKHTSVIGVLTIESKNPSLTTEQNILLTSALSLASNLISLKQASENNIRQQIKARTLKKLHILLGEKKLTQKLIGATVLLLMCILLFPANYWIVSDASLQSTYRYLVVSPQDGYLDSIKARPGDFVKKDDLLAQLDDKDLRLERRKLFSQMQQSQQEYDNALANSSRAQAAIANEKVEQASSQLQLIEQQQSRTQLLASSDGIITSDDISQSLGAPVKQGQILFEISANQGYLVQLWVDERDIAALKPGQFSRIKLTSVPNEVFEASVKSITPISEIREGKNYFRVEVTLNRETVDLRPGMTGSGKVLAGRELLGWIWFHDFWFWLRLKLWL